MQKDASLAKVAWPFFLAGFVFVVGATAFALVFRSAEYGNLGSEPSMWLESGRIDGDQIALARMLAYLSFFHINRIDKSFESNRNKSRWLHAGMATGIIGAAVLCIGALLPIV